MKQNTWKKVVPIGLALSASSASANSEHRDNGLATQEHESQSEIVNLGSIAQPESPNISVINSANSFEVALTYSDLERAGEGSRTTVWRRVNRGDFPKPDYYLGRSPRWLESSVRRRREELVAESRKRLESPK